jgi:two-component system OmpR family response regulator
MQFVNARLSGPTHIERQFASRSMSAQPASRVLTIEDDRTTAEEIAVELRGRGFSVEIVGDGNAGLDKACSGAYDAITLDRMLPGLDGLSIVTRLRAAGVHTPVLMISALSDVDERVRGLRAGGDDYLTKPFAADEMSARLEVLLRRSQAPARMAKLQVEDLELDLIARSVRRSGAALELKAMEFRLLEYMMRNSGQILTRGMIFEAVWNYRFDPYTNLIEVHMARLRRKIDLPGLPCLIHTVRGSGYCLGAPP